jgi:hypothetical protein
MWCQLSQSGLTQKLSQSLISQCPLRTLWFVFFIMVRKSYQFFSPIIQSLYVRSKWAIALLLLVLCTSCFAAKSPEVTLNLTVQPTNRPGVYNIMGTTNLSDGSQIAVSAIRYLLPTEQQFVGPDPNTAYSILARKIVEVANGKWEATLNLWQIAPDGRLQEAWQLNQSQTGLVFDPASEVSFLATFDPMEQSWKLGEQLKKTQELRGSLVRFTNEGKPYVQASKSLAIALPVGRTQPPKLQPEDINGGWGNRYEIQPEPFVTNRMRPQLPKTNQINTPLSPSEYLR